MTQTADQVSEPSKGVWTEEPRAAALARAPEFGRRFFAEMFRRFPGTATTTIFRRWSVQPGDVYAQVAPHGVALTVQIDPDLEYLIISTEDENVEFGDWDGDQVPQAIEYLGALLGGDGPAAER